MEDSIKIIRTNSENKDFQYLVKALDKELAVLDGEDHSFYAQYNKIDAIQHAVVYYVKNGPIACGAIKHYHDGIMEVKRMYVMPSERGKGIATIVLKELEKWAFELGYHQTILETGLKQKDAIKLYTKNNYQVMENYGQYIGIENSVCFKKTINPISHA